MLDAYETLPEDLDTLKEIINTPADFLNNNRELGGMVNMPFGYKNLDYSNKQIVFWDPNKDREIVLGPVSPSGIIVFSTSKVININSTSNIVNFEAIQGKENSVTLNGPISIYSEFERGRYYIHAYIVTGSYYPGYITLLPLVGDKLLSEKLPLEFTTPYIVGNDTQEHLDELYRRLNNNKTFSSIVSLYDSGTDDSFIGFGNFVYRGNNKYTLFILKQNEESETYIVHKIGGQSGQNLRLFITLNSFSDLNIERDVLNPDAPTPDWNAVEDEPGYIANRTHYKYNIDSDWYLNEDDNYAEKEISYDVYLDIYNKEYDVKDTIYLKRGESYHLNTDLNGDYNISHNGESIQITPYDEANSIVDLFKDYSFTTYKIQFLSEDFIPDTIARKDDYEALEARVAELEAKLNEITITVDE